MVVINEDQATTPDPWKEPDNRISVSFKVHDGFSSPLINFSGSNPEQIKQDIAIVTGVEVEDIDQESVFSLLTKAHEQALQIYQASAILGATVGAQKKSYGGGGNWGGKPKGDNPDAAVGKKEKPADPDQGVIDEINSATSTGDIFKVLAKHGTGNLKDEFEGWKTKAQSEAARAKFKELNQK